MVGKAQAVEFAKMNKGSIKNQGLIWKLKHQSQRRK